jgi:hypothetical protein
VQAQFSGLSIALLTVALLEFGEDHAVSPIVHW